jgi:Bax protein|tara:strand:+ start:8418 stop:9101 length:684 start_codon:yes stop_codon:yes gene_type:complete
LKLTSIPSKLIILLISVFLISAVIYYFSIEEAEIPQMTVQEKKARFKTLIIPAVNDVYAELMAQYQEISASIDAQKNSQQIEKLKVEYKATTNDELLMALKPHPKSIAIAQAAMESAWATSRFFREANNIFGVWSFDEDEPRIAALQKRGDKTIWVKKYSSVKAAVKDYYRTLGRSSAFKEFRELRMQSNDPFLLVTKLDRYSEKGAEYGHELTSIIKFNKFNKLDL